MAGAERAVEYAAEKLGQLLNDEIKLLNNVRRDVEWMREELRWMSGFIEDADAKGKNGDKRTVIWIADVIKIAQEAEDVVDTFISRIEIKNRETKWSFRRFARIPFKIIHLHKIGTEIQRINSVIRAIKERRERYGINNLGESSSSTNDRIRAKRNKNPHLPGDKFIVGFEGQKELILKRLLNFEEENLVAVPIVGMGGSGKTTLARMIYNSDVVDDWFPCRAWVTVSEEFKQFELFCNLLKQVGGNLEKCNNMNIIELKVQVHDCLKNQRYLIVLDDIWKYEEDVWEQIKDAFPDKEKGSRILITTRFLDVGKSVDPSNEPYLLPLLEEKDSWQLFLNVVFPSNGGLEPECPEILKTLGKGLVKKCGGLPLGVKVLGGLLSATDASINEWNKVANKWEYKDGNLKILALSYYHLPNANLKSCFLYIGNYPEDHIIRASELTKFWIAEGFIPKEENQTLEETAKDYLDEFVLRCMVQVVNRTKTSKRVKYLRIHDLFRKWCISEAQDDRFFRICTSSSDTSIHDFTAARRLTIYKTILHDKFCDVSYKARAILGFDFISAGNFLLSNIGQNFMLLRVIYLKFPNDVNIHESKILKGISNLIHLRNITLISDALTYLPSSIGRLHNLQTLNIRSTCITKLPITLYEIQNLRHLYARGITIQSSVNWNPKNLQTLDSINAGSWMLKDFTKFSNIRNLSLTRITQDEVSCIRDSLHKLNHLKFLHLETDCGARATSLFTSFRSHNPLSKLILINWSDVHHVFPKNLISIKLSGCTFEKEAVDSLEDLAYLANLDLLDCRILMEGEFVWSIHGFLQLEHLHIGNMQTMLDWKIVDGALPRIKEVIIKSSTWLKMLPDGLQNLKSLQKLEMIDLGEDLQRRLITTMEDGHKIPQTTIATLDGSPLDQRKRSYYIERPIKMSIGNDERIIIPSVDLSGEEHIPYKGEGTRLTVIKTMKEAPLSESKCKVTIDVVGALNHFDRPGVDLVTVLVVRRSTLGILKSAMKFLIGKLGSNDRLSIVVLSNNEPVQLCPMRQITESTLGIVETLGNNLTSNHDRNIVAGIQMGIEVINLLLFTTGRLAAIMLMLDVFPENYNYSPDQFHFGNIPVHAFSLGEYNELTEMALKKISGASMGGTCSLISDSYNLDKAFAKCFSRFLVVASSHPKMIVKEVYSTIQTVTAEYCTQVTDDKLGSVTVNFRYIYGNEVRKVIVELCLPAVETPRTEKILQIAMRTEAGAEYLSFFVEIDRVEEYEYTYLL